MNAPNRSTVGDAIRTALDVSAERRTHLEQLREALESDDAAEVVRLNPDHRKAA